MSKIIVENSIDKVKEDPCISWRDSSLLDKVKLNSSAPPSDNPFDEVDTECEKYLLNEPIPNQGRVHGYYTLIHNITAALPERSNILEVGHREGLSSLCIYDALNESSKFVTIDIVQDLRFVPSKVFKDPQFICGTANSLDPFSALTVHRYVFPNKFDLVFFDTVHTYKQISAEYNNFKNILSDDCIILVDDINIADKGKFYDEWKGQKWKLGKEFHASGFGVFVK